jgi:serine/threonine protein kinase
MSTNICQSCGNDAVLDIDVKCGKCGAPIGTTGAHRMLGTFVLGQYELVDVLGQGGMSVVYKGRHKLTDQEVALKILPPELAAHSQVKGRFLEEAKALAQLDSPHIVHLYNFGEENGCFVLAMQYVRGKTWERMIMENKRLEWAVSARICVDVLRALEYAHGRGVVHRDMKPSNVLVREDDGTATVMDFGIAKMTTSTRLTATGQTMGTVRYMSPEQVRGQEVDFRTDIYSLGATLFESLTGDTPFDGNTHFEIMTKHLSDPVIAPSTRGIEVPPVLEDALMRSLAKKPEDRWDSARSFRKAIEGVLRESDMGLAETMRLARESVASSLRGKRPSIGGPSSGAGAAAAVEAPITTPARSRAASPSLATKLEPTGSADVVPTRSRLPLIATLAVLALAGGGVAVYLATRGGAAPATIDATPARPAAFRAPGVTYTASRETDPAVWLYTVGDPPIDELAAAYSEAIAAFDAFLVERGTQAMQPELLNIVAVPRAVLCDPATSTEKGHRSASAAKCGSWVHYYRPTDRTLIVAGERDVLGRALRRGIADYFATHHRALETDAAAFIETQGK